MSFDTKPGRGSERVKAWVYAILNPVIDSLRSETGLLKSGNLSWRMHSKRCEYIRPVDELIDPAHQPILDDFLAEDPTFRDRFSEHDSALAGLEDSAATFFQTLIKAVPFQEQVAKCLREYGTSVRISNPTYPDLADILTRAPEYVAEYLVNNTKSLPRHHTMYPFWNTFEPEFAAFKHRQTFKVIENSAQDLLKVSEKLRLDLESLRLNLCREFDIPAAPFDPTNASPEHVLPRFRQ